MKILFKLLRKIEYLKYDINGFFIKKQFERYGINFKCWGNFVVKNPEKISIGNNIAINDNVYINGSGGIILGNKVVLSAHCMLISTGLDTINFINEMIHVDKPIKIGNNVQIGAGSIILAGVTIGDNVIVGAGSIVTKNIPSNCVAVGSPAKSIKKLEEI